MFCIPAKHRRFFLFPRKCKKSVERRWAEVYRDALSEMQFAIWCFQVLCHWLSPTATPYFTNFALAHCLILQIFFLRNALFYIFHALPLPYFASFLSPQRLILQISRPPIALFYKFSSVRTPYFTYFEPPHCLILQVFARQNALFYIFRARSLPYFTSFPH